MTRTLFALSMLMALPAALQAKELKLTLTSVDGPLDRLQKRFRDI